MALRPGMLRASGPVPAILVALALLVPVAAGEAGSETKIARSAEGGFTLAVPRDWRIDRRAGAGTAQLVAGREKVHRGVRGYTYGVTITRTAGYRPEGLAPDAAPADLAAEDARRIAASAGAGERTTVTPQTLEIKAPGDMEVHAFRIVVGGEGPACRVLWLVVGIAPGEWLRATWELPCAERAARAGEVEAMTRSLVVDAGWSGRPAAR